MVANHCRTGVVVGAAVVGAAGGGGFGCLASLLLPF